MDLPGNRFPCRLCVASTSLRLGYNQAHCCKQAHGPLATQYRIRHTAVSRYRRESIPCHKLPAIVIAHGVDLRGSCPPPGGSSGSCDGHIGANETGELLASTFWEKDLNSYLLREAAAGGRVVSSGRASIGQAPSAEKYPKATERRAGHSGREAHTRPRNDFVTNIRCLLCTRLHSISFRTCARARLRSPGSPR